MLPLGVCLITEATRLSHGIPESSKVANTSDASSLVDQLSSAFPLSYSIESKLEYYHKVP